MAGNTTNWILQLVDKVTGPMQKLTQNAKGAASAIDKVSDASNRRLSQTAKVGQSAANSMKSQMLAATKAVEGLSTTVKELNDNLTKLGRNDAAKKIQRQVGNMQGVFSGGLMKSIVGGNLISGLLSKGVSLVSETVMDSVKTAMDFGATQKSFEVLSGSSTIGKGLTSQLNALQQSTILGPEVFKSAQTLMSFGITADKVIKIEKQLGDVSMGNKDKFESLTLAFAQTQSAGKLMGQDLLQYINAGFNPLQVISEKTGKSMGELKKMMEDGAISSELVAQAFEAATASGGKFNNMMDQIAQTSAGRMQILQGQWENFKLYVGNSLEDTTNGLMDFTSKLLGMITPTESAAAATQKQIEKIRILQTELTSSNTTHARSIEILKELKDINPDIVKGINQQSIEYGKLADNINRTITALGQKKIADQIEGSVVGDRMAYTDAMSKRTESIANTIPLISEAAPEIAARTDMTLGQKQAYAMQKLRKQISSGNVHSYQQILRSNITGAVTETRSKEGDLLQNLTKNINQSWDAKSAIDRLSPSIKKADQQMKVAMDTYNKAFGINQGATGAPMKIPNAGDGKKTGKAGSTGSSSKSDGLSISGSAQGKIITMNLNIKNVFSDIKNNMDVRKIADQVAGYINDQMRDAALSL